jgi:hypothetical protein
MALIQISALSTACRHWTDALPQSWKITFDYQYIINSPYNRDRGPVPGSRLHWQ